MGAIHDHIRSADLEKLMEVIKNDPESVNSIDEKGFPALTLASYHGNLELTKILVEKGALIDNKDSVGNTALMGVAFKGFKDIAKYLLELGADPNASNSLGHTPLIYTVMFDKLEMAKLLIEAGADLKVLDGQGNSLAKLAKKQGNEEMYVLVSSK